MKIILSILFILFVSDTNASVKSSQDSLALMRMWKYSETIRSNDTITDTIERTSYVQYRYNIARRNPLLLIVPRLYEIAHGRRKFAGELVFKSSKREDGTFNLIKQLDVSTVPHHSNATPSMQNYLTPNIYDEKIFIDRIISPFYYDNRVYYKYDVQQRPHGVVEVFFRPKITNTQLVKGRCYIDGNSGKVIWFEFRGNFDMLSFFIKGTMDEGTQSLYVKEIDVDTKMSLLGNKLLTYFHAEYDLPELLPDSVRDCTDFKVADNIRPTPLPAENRNIYDEFNKIEKNNDLKKEQRPDKEDKFFKSLKKVGESLVFQTGTSFGPKKRGNFNISPLINPLYFGYSSQRGLYYRMAVNADYDFSENSMISLYANGGYSFKQKLVYYSIPLRFTYNLRKNGYVEFVVGNGNRITNSDILDAIKGEKVENINWDKMDLNYFKDFRLDLNTNYDVHKKWSLRPGITYHRRSAVNPGGFIRAGKPYVFYSTAPRLGVQWRPLGHTNLCVTAEIEASIKYFLGSDFSYDRTEIDAVWRKELKKMRCLQLRGGVGFYTVKGKDSYFLDYTNFSQNNIPGGWNDNWTGDFKMLDANWYNASNYYVRWNVTWETPMLIASRVPFVGKFVEMERLYVNALSVEKITPYTEWGYGFKNRLFSAGFFTAFRTYKYYGMGVRFELELFSRW